MRSYKHYSNELHDLDVEETSVDRKLVSKDKIIPFFEHDIWSIILHFVGDKSSLYYCCKYFYSLKNYNFGLTLDDFALTLRGEYSNNNLSYKYFHDQEFRERITRNSKIYDKKIFINLSTSYVYNSITYDR